jgi:hypothetical protein
VADGGHADAGPEVDEPVAVDVDEDGAVARLMYTGSADETPAETTFTRRACRPSDFGTGIAVTI